MDTPITRRAVTDRPNAELAAAIDEALTLLNAQGARAAATFLEQRGAGFALTCRVLAEPDRRRARTVISKSLLCQL